MVKYFKPVNNWTTITEKKIIGTINPADDNYVVVPQNYFAFFVKDNEITAVKKTGTFDLTDFDCDSIYFYLEDIAALSIGLFMRQPITCKLSSGNLVTVKFNTGFNLQIEEINDKTLELFKYNTFTTDDAAQLYHDFLYSNAKNMFKEYDFNPESFNVFDVEYELSFLIKAKFEEYLAPYGFKTSSLSITSLVVNDPTFFEEQYDDSEPKNEKATTHDENLENAFGSMLNNFFKATSEGKTVEEAKNKAETEFISDLFGGLFGTKK